MAEFISPAQIRGARGMLNWSMLDLAKASQVSVSTIKRIEDGAENTTSDRSFAKLLIAFEAEGVVFASDADLGRGMWVKKRDPGAPPLTTADVVLSAKR